MSLPDFQAIRIKQDKRVFYCYNTSIYNEEITTILFYVPTIKTKEDTKLSKPGNLRNSSKQNRIFICSSQPQTSQILKKSEDIKNLEPNSLH